MPDVFISYSVKDEEFAKFVHNHLRIHNLDVFFAPISLTIGSQTEQAKRMHSSLPLWFYLACWFSRSKAYLY